MEITEAQIKKMIEDAIDAREVFNNRGVSLIPYHIHSGVDSPLVYKTIFRGQTQLSSGVSVVSNSVVSLTSLIYISYAVPSATLGILYISYQDKGTFTITSKKTDNTGTQTADISLVNYLIANQ